MTSVTDLLQSQLAVLAQQTWGGGRFVESRKPSDYNPDLVARIYHEHLMPEHTAPRSHNQSSGGGGGSARVRGRGGSRGGGAAVAAFSAGSSASTSSSLSPRQVLEVSSYLEFYLLPFFADNPASVSFEHIMSMVLMINEKAREAVDLWAAFAPKPPSAADASSSTGADAAAKEAAEARFSNFFTRVLLLRGEAPLSMRERSAHTQFLIHAFASLENATVRRCALRLASLPLWLAVAPTRVELELASHPHLRKPWARVLKEHDATVKAAAAGELASVLATPAPGPFHSSSNSSGNNSGTAGGGASAKRRRPADDAAVAAAVAGEAADGASSDCSHGFPSVPALPVSDAAAMAHIQQRLDSSFLPSLVAEFLSTVESLPPAPSPLPAGVVRYLERVLELFIDLLSQLPTRRFFRTLLEDAHFHTRCRRSALASRSPHAPSPLTVATATVGKKAGTSDSSGSSGRHSSSVASGSGTGSSRGAAPGQEGRVFTQLLEVLRFFAGFEIDDHTGAVKTEADVSSEAYLRVQVLQRLAHRHFVAPFASASKDDTAAAASSSGSKKAAAATVDEEAAARAQLAKDMSEFALSAVGPLVASREALAGYLDHLSDAQLTGLARRLRLLPMPDNDYSSNKAAEPSSQPQKAGVKRPRPSDSGSAASSSSSSPSGASADAGSSSSAAAGAGADSTLLALTPSIPQPSPLSRDYVMDVLLTAHERRVSQLSAINRLPLYPSEQLLWDFNLVPGGRFGGDDVLALPKLNLQFLSFYDYLLRCFTLYRLESAYEIRADIVDAVKRMAPRQVLTYDRSGFATQATAFTGWSRMALPLLGTGPQPQHNQQQNQSERPRGFRIIEVQPARVGEEVPSRVVGEAAVDLGRHAPFIRQEWDALREHDAVFLVTVRCPVPHDRDPAEWWAEQQQQQAQVQAAAASKAASPEESGEGEGAETARIQLDSGRHQQQPQHQQNQRGGGNRRSGGALPDEEDPSFPLRMGIIAVRGGEVLECRDERGDVYNDPHARPEERNRRPAGTRRTLRLLLDPAQYHADMLAAKASGSGSSSGTGAASEGAAGGVYSSFNLLIRRRGEANNFKAVLATIRDVMNVAASSGESLGSALPPWLHDIFLGYGDPSAAHYKSLPPPSSRPADILSCPWRQLGEIDYKDTFLSADHVRGCFPGREVVFVSEEGGQALDPDSPAAAPPYRVRFEAPSKSASSSSSSSAGSTGGCVVVIPYRPAPPGPYPEDIPRANDVAFTPTQVAAITSGINPGLTMVVGPPGTGKTDTAVQIISTLYHNFPGQRILLVTHSNQALNDLFEKILARDIPEHHLLRLGAGEKELATSKDFSKWGRVNHALSRRLTLLGEVGRLATSLGVPGDHGYTCETAEYFALYHVTSRIEAFRHRWGVPPPPAGSSSSASASAAAGGFSAVSAGAAVDDASSSSSSSALTVAATSAVVGTSSSAAAARIAYRKAVGAKMAGISGAEVAASFPFGFFFATTPGGLASLFPPDASGLDALTSAEACFTHLTSLFAELASYRAFELLRTQRARTDYLLTKQARVVAMTCTHAALTRAHLIELGFKYDTLVMEEAAQVTEVETLIPMLLQQGTPGTSSSSSSASSNTGGAAGAAREMPRLKRVILIGDHNQLPPVVQNMALQKYARLDQSLFARWVRLGVPSIQLNAQGRMRPSLAALYKWRYPGLGDLPFIASRPEFGAANAGFVHDFQLVDVPDYGGVGESCPLPHFYQNLGEAEYVVAVYQYMRLCGYPANRIAILTTYNGQKALLKDVLKRRCAGYGVFGEPARVETVDKFQGQQADYVLLSLVRTRAVGHLRDVRRLTVALSRARLGLYVFGRAALFANCLELQPAFAQMTSASGRPTSLRLLVGEQWPTARPAAAAAAASAGANSSAETAAAAEAVATSAVEASGGLLTPVDVSGVDHMGSIVARILGAQMALAYPAQQQLQQPSAASASAAAGLPSAGGGRGSRRPQFGEGQEGAEEEEASAAAGRDYEPTAAADDDEEEEAGSDDE